MGSIIAIDGPAGSGKSTVAKLVAKEQAFTYIDTGAMYRALTLKAVRQGLDLEDEGALVKLAQNTRIDITNDKTGKLQVFLDGENAATLIRKPEVTNKVSYIARVEGVRREMVKLQQEVGRRGNCVFEGRDITTVVFPESRYKFYLDADLAERAKRRYKELTGSGEKVSLEDVRKNITERDHKDKTRAVGPLRRARGAIYIDTTDMSIPEVVDKVCSYIS